MEIVDLVYEVLELSCIKELDILRRLVRLGSGIFANLLTRKLDIDGTWVFDVEVFVNLIIDLLDFILLLLDEFLLLLLSLKLKSILFFLLLE